MYIDSAYLQRTEESNIDDIEQLFTCSICEGILNKPYQCKICQNNFCEHCIKEWEEKNHSCPMRCSNYSFEENICLFNLLSNILFFKCQKGCGTIIPYSKLEEHINYTCPNVNIQDFRQKFEDLSIEFENYKIRFETKKYTNLKLKKCYENLIVENAEIKAQIRSYENIIDELNLQKLYDLGEINLNDLIQRIDKNIVFEKEDLIDEKIITKLNIEKIKRENNILNRKNERLENKIKLLK